MALSNALKTISAHQENLQTHSQEVALLQGKLAIKEQELR